MIQGLRPCLFLLLLSYAEITVEQLLDEGVRAHLSVLGLVAFQGSQRALSHGQILNNLRSENCSVSLIIFLISFTDLPPLLKKGLEEVVAGKYLNALLDILQFQSTNSWTSELFVRVMAFLSTQDSSIAVSGLQTLIRNYLESLFSQPRLLLSELQQTDTQQFLLAMNYLFRGRKEKLDLQEFMLDFETLRARIWQSPVGNRTLFQVSLEKCLPALNCTDCVQLLGQVLRMSSGSYLQPDTVSKLPTELQDEPFRNLSVVFKDLYEKISASTQKAVYDWMTLILQRSCNFSELNESTSWVTAENLWLLGRYMVHLPLEEIQTINLSEIRLFISYDNATKQLDTVYDITPQLAKAFLERIESSGFDMRNISTIHRLGLLVCFYEDLEQMDASLARALLHQMIKCNQLRGFHAAFRKLKTQLLAIAMLNQTLNETLGSLSDAVVGLSPCQLESLAPEAVQSAIATLQQVSGWTKSQAMILAGKYLSSEKVVSSHNISQMGELVSGIGTPSFHGMSPKELSQVVKGALAQGAADLSPAQKEGILSKMLAAGDFTSAVTDVQGAFFKEVSLANLLKSKGFDASTLKERELRRSQALFLFESLSKKTSPADLLSTGQLVKGMTCEQIQAMKLPSFVTTYKAFEKNLPLLSPFQVNCLAWKFWNVANTSVPPFLLSVLPTEYLGSLSTQLCVPFLIKLGKAELDSLILNSHKKKAVMEKVQQCLNGSLADEYDVDLLGKLICHLPPRLVQGVVTRRAAEAVIQSFRACKKLSEEQKAEIKAKLLELYGNPEDWTAEAAQDAGPFLVLLPKEEFVTVAEKFPDTVLQMAAKAMDVVAPTDEILFALFNAVRNSSASVGASGRAADCPGLSAPSSDDILKLAEANCFWSIEELRCLDAETFTKTVELLGAVRRFGTSQLIALKEKARQVWGALPAWKTYHIVALGSIAVALNDTEIEELDLSSIDTVAALSQQEEWTHVQARAILQGFLEDSARSIEELKSYDLVGLGTILCAMDPKQIPKIKATEFSAGAARIGSLLCPIPVLQAFKRKAESVFGKSKTWTRSVFQEVGVIAAGLTKEDVKALNKDLLPYFQPAAITHIPAHIFK
ncbi:otoancorin [Rhinatrema bivittatum]|uniref:otoancorin n=1 Tax=Rhinatrema bivittatum TaxID=194408 RepID=UPI00112C9561|nr:otoancorin [Rhinatrema bivittatum]